MADNTNSLTNIETDLLNELSQLIEQSKQQVSVQANSAVTILFWQIQIWSSWVIAFLE